MKHFKPGDHPDDYRYLFDGHSEVLTESERKAWTNIIVAAKSANTANPAQSKMLQERWMNREPDVMAMLADGEAAFFRRVFDRVNDEAADALMTCPECGSLSRTSAACLCPHCSHSWFEARLTQRAEQVAGPDA